MSLHHTPLVGRTKAWFKRLTHSRPPSIRTDETTDTELCSNLQSLTVSQAQPPSVETTGFPSNPGNYAVNRAQPPSLGPNKTTDTDVPPNAPPFPVNQAASPSARPDESTEIAFFPNAHDFTINNGQFINANTVTQTNHIKNVISQRHAVFELLEPYACLDATKDSSARHPPPRCHPETRLKIREKLTQWLFDEYDEWKMLWVRGSAGTGKSAVAQSFGDYCGEAKRHGASYFFSRAAGRNKPETVVPTIVCQLATAIPEYRSLVGHQLANNPFLLRKSSPLQFRELVLEPFATLQLQQPRQPIVIILDGLDECEGETAQREILEMVTSAVRSSPDLPLRWLIFSRPEAHLKNAFSRNVLCGREELINDAECRQDVERYVKDRLVEIKNAYHDVTPPEWPLQHKLRQFLEAVSGLFVFASTCLTSIADPDIADPASQLDSLLTFLRTSQGVMSRNPLAVLDLLYSRILERIPPTVYGTTRRILAYMSYRDKLDVDECLYSAQALSNFLQLDQYAFYKAARGLHSVIRILEPEDADQAQLRFYHASFQDFLRDPIRSGKFYISKRDALAEIVQSCVHWYDVYATDFHTGDGRIYNYLPERDCLRGLTWVSGDNRLQISHSIKHFSANCVLDGSFLLYWHCTDQTFLSRLSDIDFRNWESDHIVILAILCQLDPSTSVVRVEPSSDTDHQLLQFMNLVIGHGTAKPAKFPLQDSFPRDKWVREYFLIGHGVKSVIFWRTTSPSAPHLRSWALRSDRDPSEEQISRYATFLRDIKWDEAKAKAKMK